jgi:hypothetical protein
MIFDILIFSLTFSLFLRSVSWQLKKKKVSVELAQLDPHSKDSFESSCQLIGERKLCISLTAKPSLPWLTMLTIDSCLVFILEAMGMVQ